MKSNPQLANFYMEKYQTSIKKGNNLQAQRQELLAKIERLEQANRELDQQIENINSLLSNDFSRLEKVDGSRFRGSVKGRFLEKCTHAKQNLMTYQSKQTSNKGEISSKIKELQDEPDSLLRKSSMAFTEADSYYSIALSYS